MRILHRANGVLTVKLAALDPPGEIVDLLGEPLGQVHACFLRSVMDTMLVGSLSKLGAHFSPWRGELWTVVLDTMGATAALRALSNAGVLPARTGVRSWSMGSCPRCGRPTSVRDGGLPTVCAACRAEYLAEHAPQSAEWNHAILRRDDKR